MYEWGRNLGFLGGKIYQAIFPRHLAALFDHKGPKRVKNEWMLGPFGYFDAPGFSTSTYILTPPLYSRDLIKGTVRPHKIGREWYH